MKDYLKMADVFVGEVKHEQNTLYTLKSEGFKKGGGVFVNDVWACFNGHSDAAKCAANAINSHDELVEMNQVLLEALDEIAGCFEAAMVDGWIDAVANDDVSLINDIYCRRIDYARHIAISTLTGGSV